MRVALGKRQPCRRLVLLVAAGALLPPSLLLSNGAPSDQAATPAPQYHIYAGNTHAHTVYTWSHGEQWVKAESAEGKPKEPGIHVSPEGAQFPGKSLVLKPDWKSHQGSPAEHFARGRARGYDFYAVTDHSQEAKFQPPSPSNTQWRATLRAADEATDDRFVALVGYEHSENNGPGGRGHLNVFNSAEYLNALAPGVDLPYLYRWLKTARANGQGPVVASFNHPGPHQYNDWDYRDPEITDIITMLEVINSNNKIHYEAFVKALDKGWKVSPVCGNDNHGFYGIAHHTSRTFVLATERTKSALLEAMKQRRTYAALVQNLRCRYTVNGAVMGSTLNRPDVFRFNIAVRDPDTTEPRHKITRIDIVKDGGVVALAYRPTPPAHTVTWNPTIKDSTSKYFWVFSKACG
jgi:hypothetical protein